ncbi:MAG: hypothetical protein FJX77_13005 [Armatimonadetes bacterium]|nr:hypothetical protein [Armatimonadota bacterium]
MNGSDIVPAPAAVAMGDLIAVVLGACAQAPEPAPLSGGTVGTATPASSRVSNAPPTDGTPSGLGKTVAPPAEQTAGSSVDATLRGGESATRAPGTGVGSGTVMRDARPSSPEPAGRTVSGVAAGLQLTATVSQVRRLSDSRVELSLTLALRNTSIGPVEAVTRTTQLFDAAVITTSNKAAKRWSDERLFLQVLTPRTLSPGAEVSQTLTVELSARPGDEISVTASSVPLEVSGADVVVITPAMSLSAP